MPKSWADVSSSDAFKALPPVERDAARTQYFDQVVAPKAKPEEVEAVRTQFLRETANDVAPNKDTPEKIVKRNTLNNEDPLGSTAFTKSLATGIATALPGAVGDADALIRGVSHQAFGSAVSPKSKGGFPPTSADLDDALIGKPKGFADEAGRFLGGVVGGPGVVKALEKTAAGAGKVGSTTLGVMAGTGARPVEEAFKAGRAGGQQAKIFLDNMTGKAPLEDVVTSARQAVETMKLERQAAYKASMDPIKRNVTFLDMAPIDAAMAKNQKIGLNRTGTIETIPGARQVHKAISDVVDEFRKNLALRTPEDFDEMKKAINNLQYHGDLKNVAGPGTPGSIIIRDARDAISAEINRVTPDYAKAMKDYEEASDALDEVNRGLSLRDKATVQSGLRSLQSVMRNNVQTSYGYRTKLVEELDKKAGGKLMPALAGQALSSWEPRGLSRYLAGAEAMASLNHPAVLGMIPMQSSRVVGNLAYGAGRASRPIAKYVTPGNAFYNALASQTNNALQ